MNKMEKNNYQKVMKVIEKVRRKDLKLYRKLVECYQTASINNLESLFELNSFKKIKKAVREYKLEPKRLYCRGELNKRRRLIH